MAVRSGSTDAVKVVQQVVSALSAKRLKVDGVIGPATFAAYSSLTQPQKKVVNDFALSVGVNVAASATRYSYNLGRIKTVVKNVDERSRSSIISAIEAEAKSVGVSPKLATIVADVESGLNPNAKNASGATGLFQLTSSAINDVARVYGSALAQPPGGDRTNAAWNIAVGVRYIKICAGYMGVSPTDDSTANVAVIYGAFNIGAGAMRRVLGRSGAASLAATERAISGQASALKKGGVANYYANAQKWVSASRYA